MYDFISYSFSYSSVKHSLSISLHIIDETVISDDNQTGQNDDNR